MNTEAKIKLVSNILRYGTFAFGVLFIAGLISQYIFGYTGFDTTNHSFHFDLTPWKSYQELKANPNTSIVGIVFFPLLTATVISITTFYFYRLFTLYSKGDFFSDNVITCYVVLLWTRVVEYLYTSLFEWLISLFDPQKNSFIVNVLIDTQPLCTKENCFVTISFQTRPLFTLVVLLVITYILKVANQLNKENQEFV